MQFLSFFQKRHDKQVQYPPEAKIIDREMKNTKAHELSSG